MKKKKSGAPPEEMVHFRPGSELGQAINDCCASWKTSRGEAAKRLVSLAIHGLDLDFYGVVVDLMDYLSDNLLQLLFH